MCNFAKQKSGNMYFSIILPDLILLLLAGAILCAIILLIIYLLRVHNVTMYCRRANRIENGKPNADYLPASVIVYSQGDDESLSALLQQILTQNYPAPFEVIVVNDGESTDIRDTVTMLRATHSNLYLTFTPEGVVNLSRKKLALTLGIKAARHDVVVLTTTAATIESDQWLSSLMSHFDKEGNTEVTLGFAYIAPEEDKELGFRGRAFEHVAESVRWLGAAIAGKPFRGTEYNIAYRREAFMRNKGFARTLNLCYGDDDIFISEIATGDNTAVELSQASMVRACQGNFPRNFMERTLRRMFTEGHIHHRPRILFALKGWLQIIAIACCIIAGILGYPNMTATAIASGIVFIIVAMDIYFWRTAMIALKSRRMFLTLPWYSIVYPLRRLSHRLCSPFAKQKKYTWD